MFLTCVHAFDRSSLVNEIVSICLTIKETRKLVVFCYNFIIIIYIIEYH